MTSQLTPADFHEIQYRSDSTNLDALSGFAKLAAADRRDLLDHIEAQREQFRKLLVALLANQRPYPLPALLPDGTAAADPVGYARVSGLNEHASRTLRLIQQYGQAAGFSVEELNPYSDQ